MTRKPLRFWLIPLLLGPAWALALEIGEIQVHSSLNQLFDARIPLPKLTPEEVGKVSVKLAPAPIFKEFQLERAPSLTNLAFAIEYNAEGQVYVKVVSTKPIQEPSLGLLLEFDWPRGKTFREFTVFLDPVQRLAQRPGDRSKTVLDTSAAALKPPVEPAPVVIATEAEPVVVAAEAEPVAGSGAPSPPAESAPRSEPAVTVAATSEPERGARIESGGGLEPETATTKVVAESVGASDQLPLPVEAPPPPPPPPSVRIYRPGDTYGPVVAGEGLWGIALKVRPDPGITRDQMTQALFQANPHAFGKAGISGLKSGAMLRIPTFREIADITGSDAARHLAGIGESVGPVAVAATAPSLTPAVTESPVAKAATGAPEVFPLEPATPLEPIAVMALLPAPIQEATQPVSAQKPAAQPSEPVTVNFEPLPAGLELFAILPDLVAPLEPKADMALLPPPIPEAAQPDSAPEPVEQPSEPVAEKSEPAPAGPESAAAPPEPVAQISEPVVVATASELEVSKLATPVADISIQPFPSTPFHGGEGQPITHDFAKVPSTLEGEGWVGESERLPADIPAEPFQGVLEPVSVTPLLFLAISEMMAAVTQPSAVMVPTPVAPGHPDSNAVMLESEREASAPETAPLAAVSEAEVEHATTLSTSDVETSALALTATLETPGAPMDTASLLAAVERFSPRMDRDALAQLYFASDASAPLVAVFTEPLPMPAMPVTPIPPPSAEEEPNTPAPLSSQAVEPPVDTMTSVRMNGAEASAPTVPDPPQSVAAGPAEPLVKADEQTQRFYKGGEQYGPISPNERLWKIAAKVRPDPGISKEHMMKALLKANPQAFSKSNNMDSLKVGATLRVPTLREIADFTGSKAAKQLLEQQQTAETPLPPEPAQAAEAPPASEPRPPAPFAAEPAAAEPLAPATEPASGSPALASEPPSLESVAPPAPATEATPASEPPAPESFTPPATAAEAPSVSEPVGPPVPDGEGPPAASEPSAPAPEAPPVSEPPTPETVALPVSAAEAPPTPELPLIAPEPSPAAEAPPVSEPPAPAVETSTAR